MFRAGQKIVYVGQWGFPVQLTKGVVYTVRGFCNEDHPNGEIGLFLCEAARDADDEYCACFDQKSFRPAVERKTDIGFAHEILRKVAKPAPARAAFQDAE